MTARPRSRTGLVVASVAAATYVVLGTAVSHVPAHGIDAAARAVTGEAPRIAWMFTESCLWPVLLAFGALGAVIGARLPVWRERIVFAIATTIAGWTCNNVLKDVFRRPRPEYWIVHHETTYSYSSGHAMFAVLVYGLWGYYVARSAWPAGTRIPLAGILFAWGSGVIWSRLALGAHYPSDLAGGVLLAVTVLGAGAAVAGRIAPRTAQA